MSGQLLPTELPTALVGSPRAARGLHVCSPLFISVWVYTSTLSTVNQLLSNIAPFALYCCCQNPDHWGRTEAKELYIHNFMDSDITSENQAKTAWLVPFGIKENMAYAMPLAIQIEFRFYDSFFHVVQLSPYVCAFYLMFLCYHELGKYNERDRALRQLVDVANTPTQCGPHPHHALNITGHCLFLAGKITQARDFFKYSCEVCQHNPPWDKHNSAMYYLQCLFQR